MFWGKEKEEQLKMFSEWRDNLSSTSIKTIEDLPEEITQCLALWFHERLEPLSKLTKKMRSEFKMEPILDEDQFRQFILKVSARRPYGVKPYYQVNEYEQEGKENLKYLWETTAQFMPEKYRLVSKEDRGVRKKQQVCVWNYWLYHKRLRTTRRGEERTRMLQTQIDKIQTWENRRKDQDRRVKEKKQLWEQQAEERAKQDKEREQSRADAMKEKMQTMAERQMERAKREAERKQLKNQKVSSAMARAIENKTVKMNKTTVYGLDHFVDPAVNANISRRSGMANRKFLPFQPEWGAEYNTKPPTLPKYFDLFFPLTYDQCTEQLLLYRTSKSHKKQSERCNGVRRENVWCYRRFHTDYRPPWSGFETRTSKKVFGRRPFAKDSEQPTDYDGEDSGVEWDGDVETEEKGDVGRETSLAMDTDGEGEDLGESDEEEFSDEDPHEGLRADGYEDDGFLDDDGDIFFPKLRKKEDRYPIRPDRTRGDKNPKPITLLLPPCLPSNHLDKKANLHPFHKFLLTRGELIVLGKEQTVVCHDDKLVLPQNLVNWRNSLIKKRKAAWIAKKKKRKRASSPTTSKKSTKKKK